MKADSGDGEDVVASTANAASASNGEEATAALLASDIKRDIAYPLTSMTIEERDAALNNRFEGGVSPLKYYDGVTHLGMFGLPKEVRTHLREETRIMTLANPVFMH